MLINQAPLAARAAALRNGTLDLMRYLGEVCDRIEALEPTVQALAPKRIAGCACCKDGAAAAPASETDR